MRVTIDRGPTGVSMVWEKPASGPCSVWKSARAPAVSSTCPPPNGSTNRVGSDADRTRKWPGMPTPTRSIPCRRATAMVSTERLIGMPRRVATTWSR